MKSISKTIFLTILILFKMEAYNASENSFGVASVIVSGKEDAVLIDAQFTVSEAEIVAQEIIKSGKNLTGIYVSHGDPDFYFGLEVFKKYFPKVTAYASAATIEHIKATAQKKLEVWGERLGSNITSNIVLPQVLKNDFIDLEGKKIEIVGLEEFPKRTFVWIPSIKTVLGGINIFGTSFHLWMADAQTTAIRSEWISILDQISALNPEIVIPAHANNNSDFSIAAVNHSKYYLQFYEEALKNNKTSEALISTLKSKYENLTFETALIIGAKVNTGEMKW